ncbi:AHH domain-containing protein [Bradyrhizobium sp.]|uniref:AHH domain-containing protein n=1 Tax=Bradyrhizobium sp. TaxID=376 RepID=UPI0039E6CC63
MSILFGHHMIPERFKHHEAFDGIDQKTLGVESELNLIYLPYSRELARRMGIASHPGGHADLYYEAIDVALKQIAKEADLDIRAVEIRKLFDALRIGFANGDLHANIPAGMTLEEFKERIVKVIKNRGAYVERNPGSLQRIWDIEREGLDSGMDHLLRWFAIVGNSEREKLLIEAIRNNPGANVTSGNKYLRGTQFLKFAPVDDTFDVPPSSSIDPGDVPLLPPSLPPSLGSAIEPEGFTRGDPRFAGRLPGFPEAGPDEQRLGQLPPSVAMPPPPQVLQFNPETSDILKFSDGSPMMGPNPDDLPHDPADGPALLGGMALFAAAMAAPALIPLLPAWGTAAGALALAGAAANSVARAEPTSSGENEASVAGPKPGNQDAEPAATFSDRFGALIGTPAGDLPAQAPSEAQASSAADAVAPEEIRRLTRMNASNAGNVFASGSAPVPYLLSKEFNDRFGNWSTPTSASPPHQTTKPIDTFAGEPNYMIPPPIFRADNPGLPRNDAEEWFSRWIQPFLRPDQRPFQ